MMIKKILIILGIILFFISCGTGENTLDFIKIDSIKVRQSGTSNTYTENNTDNPITLTNGDNYYDLEIDYSYSLNSVDFADVYLGINNGSDCLVYNRIYLENDILNTEGEYLESTEIEPIYVDSVQIIQPVYDENDASLFLTLKLMVDASDANTIILHSDNVQIILD